MSVDAATLVLNQEVRHLVVELSNGEQASVPTRAVTAVLLASADDRGSLSGLSLVFRALAISGLTRPLGATRRWPDE